MHFLVTDSSFTGFRWHSLLLDISLIRLSIVFLVEIHVNIHILKWRVDVCNGRSVYWGHHHRL